MKLKKVHSNRFRYLVQVPEATNVPAPERTFDLGGHESHFAIPVISWTCMVSNSRTDHLDNPREEEIYLKNIEC